VSIAWAWWIGLRVYPGGDSYFGALLNSLIHVMMYSYYTFSLLKISCPWKKYLTQAQLLQFFSVFIYSLWSMYTMPEVHHWTNYLAYAAQIFEMTSLFLLFLHFYTKAYRKKALAQKEPPLPIPSADASDITEISSQSSDEQSS
jgi:elongation of very long chain fatty acids protein 4